MPKVTNKSGFIKGREPSFKNVKGGSKSTEKTRKGVQRSMAPYGSEPAEFSRKKKRGKK